MDDEIFNEEDKSEFNAGLAALERCHEIKKWLAIATVNDDSLSYLRYIKMFYKELYPMMTKESDERAVQVAYWIKGKEIERKLMSDEEITEDDLDFLEEWELELRDIDQAKNMNIPKMKDGRWMLGKK